MSSLLPLGKLGFKLRGGGRPRSLAGRLWGGGGLAICGRRRLCAPAPKTQIGRDRLALLKLGVWPFRPIYGSVALRWQVRVRLRQMGASPTAGRLMVGLFSLGMVPSCGVRSCRLGPVGLEATSGVGRVPGFLGLDRWRCAPFCVGRVRLRGCWRELASKEVALGWRELAPRGTRMWDATASRSLSLIGFYFGMAWAIALVREGLISLRAARGPAGGLFSFNLL